MLPQNVQKLNANSTKSACWTEIATLNVSVQNIASTKKNIKSWDEFVAAMGRRTKIFVTCNITRVVKTIISRSRNTDIVKEMVSVFRLFSKFILGIGK